MSPHYNRSKFQVLSLFRCCCCCCCSMFNHPLVHSQHVLLLPGCFRFDLLCCCTARRPLHGRRADQFRDVSGVTWIVEVHFTIFQSKCSKVSIGATIIVLVQLRAPHEIRKGAFFDCWMRCTSTGQAVCTFRRRGDSHSTEPN